VAAACAQCISCTDRILRVPLLPHQARRPPLEPADNNAIDENFLDVNVLDDLDFDLIENAATAA